jgi:hypothetical protein
MEKMFANGDFEVKVSVDEIKVLLWKWGLKQLKMAPVLCYEWICNPIDCFERG